MNRPSEKALTLGEELVDYVPYGLTRFNAVQELAEMVDEANRDLLDGVRAVLQNAQLNGGVPAASYIANLRRVFLDYEPIGWSSDSQGERGGAAQRRHGPGKNLSLRCKLAPASSV